MATTVSRGNSASSSDDSKKPVVVDVTSGSLDLGESRKLNVSVDPESAFGAGAPPPKGMYKFKLMPLGKDSVTKRWFSNSDEFYYSVNVELKVVSDDKDLDGFSVNTYLSTAIGRGKELSTLAAFIMLCGKDPLKKGESEIADGTLIKRFATYANSAPLVESKLGLDWRASYQAEDETWKNILNRYEDFPEDGKGGRHWECEVTVPGPNGKPVSKDVRAQAFINWRMKETTRNEESTSKTVSKKEVDETPVPQATKQSKAKVTPVIEDIDEL